MYGQNQQKLLTVCDWRVEMGVWVREQGLLFTTVQFHYCTISTVLLEITPCINAILRTFFLTT